MASELSGVSFLFAGGLTTASETSGFSFLVSGGLTTSELSVFRFLVAGGLDSLDSVSNMAVTGGDFVTDGEFVVLSSDLFGSKDGAA